ERPREETVLAARHPVRERLPRIVIRRKTHRRGAESGGLHGLLRLLVRGGGHGALGENHFIARLRTRLAAHLRKERGEAVVILLAPALERMMMALRAFQPLAEKYLRGVLKLRRGVLDLAIPCDGRILRDIAGRGEKFAHEFIVRLVLQQAVTHPGVK